MNYSLRPSAFLISCLFLSMLALPSRVWAQEATPSKEIAITFDDLPLGGPQFGVDRMRAMTSTLLDHLQAHQITSVGFVNERKLHVLGEMDERTDLLRKWLQAGQELGNHTYSHPSFYNTPLDEYQEEVMRGETITGLLLEEKDQVLRYFRHPFLNTGPTLEVKTAFETFLKERGYTVAPVTIENLDWLYNQLYTLAKDDGNAKQMHEIGEAYVAFTEAQFDFWEEISESLLGYQIKHVLLLHANEINAAYLDALIDLMKGRGYAFITLEEAMQDDAYQLPDTYVGRAGVSWLYRWAYSKEVQFDWRLEPQPSTDIQERYQQSRNRN